MKISLQQKGAIQILVARDLNFETVAFISESEKIIKGGNLEPIKTIYFLRESDRVADLILRNNLLEEALKLSENYFAQLNNTISN